MFFSIAIPTYEMKGKGCEFLNHSLNILYTQSFKDFEIVISDHSRTNDIEELCQTWIEKLNIKYHRNDYMVGSSSANINTAIKLCSGDWIKILFQDDFLYDENSLLNLYNFIKSDNQIFWVASACAHSNDGINLYRPFYPKWTNDIHLGNNLISSPSVITIKNIEEKILFSEELIWLMDVDFYKKMFMVYGEPKYFNIINIVNRTWENSVSNTLPENIKNKEVEIMRYKYDNN